MIKDINHNRMADNAEEVQYGEDYNPEEDKVEGNFKKIDLPEVAKVTGEEGEKCLVSFRSKLYRWRSKEWKERGLGDLKILQSADGQVRVLHRQDHTHKIIANFQAIEKDGMCTLVPMKTAEKSWQLDVCDFSEETPSLDKLCFKFTSKESKQLLLSPSRLCSL